MRGNQSTISGDQTTDIEPVRLRLEVFEALTAKRGAGTDADRARLFRLPRYAAWRLRQKDYEPTLRTAMHVARSLNTKVEKLWGPASEVNKTDVVDEVA